MPTSPLHGTRRTQSVRIGITAAAPIIVDIPAGVPVATIRFAGRAWFLPDGDRVLIVGADQIETWTLPPRPALQLRALVRRIWRPG